MKRNRKIRKQLQAYLCMLVMAVQSLTPVMQVSAEEVTTVDVSAQAAEAETVAENAADAVTVSDAGTTQEIPVCDITAGTLDEADGWSLNDEAEYGYKELTIRKNGTYRLTGSNAAGYNFYILVESGLDAVKLIMDDVVICNVYGESTILAADSQEPISTYEQQSDPVKRDHVPLILESDTEVILQGTAFLEGNDTYATAIWGDNGSSLLCEDGVFHVNEIKVSYVHIKDAFLWSRYVAGQRDEELEYTYMRAVSKDLDLESVWLGGQKYDVSGLEIQIKYGWTEEFMVNRVNTPAVEFLFDGGILYSYRFSKAVWEYKQVVPTQEHCTVIYEEDGYEVGRAYCVPGGNVELWPSNEEAQMQYVVKETGESFDGCNVAEDMTVELLPDTAYGIDVTINGEVQRFARGDSLPEGYFYIATFQDGSYQTVYDCRPGKEKVVVKRSMQLLALRCGDSADHLEFMIDSAEDLNAYSMLLFEDYQKNGVKASEADLKLTKDITIDSMVRAGYNDGPFYGTLDGQNHTITLDLTVDEADNKTAAGLFQRLAGIVKNLTIDGRIQVQDRSIAVGGIAGIVCGEKNLISHCSSDVDIYIEGSDMRAGGLVGRVDAGSLQISDSSMNGMLVANGADNCIAGLVGYFDAGSLQIDRCHVTSVMDITSENTIVSGIANELANAQDMTINNCYVSGEIKRGAQGKSGVEIYGLAYAQESDSDSKVILTNCYNEAEEKDSGNGSLMLKTVGGALQTNNCYYVMGQCEEQPELTGVTEEQVKNGALCYLLNQGNTEDPIWYQTIGSDLRPVTEADEHAVVYEKTDSETGEKVYENAKGTVVSPEAHKYKYVTMRWGEEDGQVIAYGQFRCENCKEFIGEPAEVTIERIEPDCEEDGEIIYTATLTKDGKTYTGSMEETIPATRHNYGSWELTANGDGIRVCQNPGCDEYEECDHSREEPYQKVVSANDCIPVDYEATFCSVCGLNISDAQEQESHAYVEELIAPEAQRKSGATCEEKAVYFAICKRCHRLDMEHTFEAGACTGHTIWEVKKYKWNKDNSCDLVYECYECESIQTKKMEVTRTVLQERTCMQSGKYVYSAVLEEDDDDVYKAPDKEVKVPATGHALAGGNMKFTEVTGADGKPVVTAVLPIHCNNDNCTYRQNIPAIVEAGKDTATCVADGTVTYTAKVIWNAQTYTDTYQVKTTKHGHKLKSYVAKKEATTEQAGMQAYYTCENCDGKFADQALTKPVTDAELAIPKLTAPEGQPSQKPQPGQNPQPGKNPQGGQEPDVKPEVIRQKDGSGITIISKKKKEVSYTGAKKTKTSLTVPAEVKIGKKTYKVTKLADHAFKGNKKLKKLTLPKSCIYIGTEAFSGCTKLKTLTIKSKKLTEKTVADHAFKGISKKTVIKVPKSKVDTYRKLFREKGLNKKVKIRAI